MEPYPRPLQVERDPDASPEALDMIRAFENVLPVLQRFLSFRGAALFVGEPQGLRPVSGYQLPFFRHVIGRHLPWNKAQIGIIQATRRELVLEDVDAEPGFVKLDPRVTIRSWIGVPIFLEEEMRGLLSIMHPEPGRFTAQDGELAYVLTQQVAISVEKERLLQAEQRRRREAEALRDATTALTLDLEPEAILVELLRRLRRVVPFESAGVLLREARDRVRVVAALDVPHPEEVVGRTFSGDNTLFQTIVRTGRAVYYPDVQATGAFHGWGGTHYVRSWMGVPLRHRGAVIGYITLDHSRFNAYNPDDMALAQAFANQVTATVINAQLFQQVRHAAEENRRRADELTALDRLQRALRDAVTVQQVLEASLQCLDIFQAQHASISMPDTQGTLRVVHQLGPVQALDIPPMELGQSLVGRVYATGEPYLTNDAFGEAQAATGALEVWRRQGFQRVRALFAPLRTGTEIVGVMTLMAGEGRYTEQELRLFSTMAEIVGSALARAQLLETLEERVAARTQELQQAYEQLQELDRLKSRFVANVSHELRTPLTNIKFYLELVERGTPERRAQYMATIHQEVDHLQDLIESVLDLTRLEEERETGMASAQPVDLAQLAQDVVARLEPLAGEHRVTLQVDVPAAPVWTYGSPTRLAQVINNLVSNAIRYNRPQGQVAVRVSWDEGHHTALLQVEDTGIGIPREEQQHIFQRFYRGSQVNHRVTPGTGLGLNIVQEIVAIHGGQVEVESEPGRGSVFTVRLPASRAGPVVESRGEQG